MNLPSLTVLLPNYNHARYLPECLDALIAQTVKVNEIIIIDDGSTDDSWQIILKYASKNPNITNLKNDRNRGVNYTMNRALDLVKTDYVYFCAADDIVLPELFEKELTALQASPEAGLCFSDPASFDETGVINPNNLNLSPQKTYFSPASISKLAREKRLIISGMSVLKTSAVKETNGFKDFLKWHSDFFTLFTIVFRHGACYIPEQLNLWRATRDTYMTRGLRDWRAQDKVMQNMLDLLKTEEYSDVVGRFISSGVLSNCPRASFTILVHRKYWSFMTWTLLRKSIAGDIFWSLPYFVQRILRRLMSR